MTTGDFEPIHKEHAIEQVIVQLGFDKELADAEFALKRWQTFHQKVVPILPAMGQEAGVRIEHVPPMGPRVRTGVVAYTYSRIRPDGSPGIQLRVERDNVSFVATVYSRWSALKSECEEVVKSVMFEIFGSTDVKLQTVSLQYLDRFLWNNPEIPVDNSKLIRRNSPWISEKVATISEEFHCHSGFFVRSSDSLRRLFNVNIDGVRQNKLDKVDRSIGILTITTDALNQPGYDRTEFADGASSFDWAVSRLDSLHDDNKNILIEILTSSQRERIGLPIIGHESA